MNISRFTYLIIVLSIGIVSCSENPKIIVAETTKPEENRFTPVVLTPEGSLDEPMVFQIAHDGSIFIIERKGALKKFDPATREVKVITTLPVFTDNEQGLIGLSLDPDFEKNNWLYLHYAPADEKIFKLIRVELKGDKLVEGSEKTLLKIPVDRDNTNHTGGGMAWDKQGNLYLTVGNNTGNNPSAQTDERPDHSFLDDQRGAANTNDLRGKILRIHPEDDGTYSIPSGNLFPVGTAKTRPEIYTMGHRNVWRVSVDSKTGWIYWGEIGPDQDSDTDYGPRGYDEQNQAKGPGFFGWPYFIANNQAIPKYDFVNKKILDKMDSLKPVNTSPNNTGLRDLPPATPAFIYYPYTASEKFPLVGSSSRCAIGGPIYHRDDFKNPARPFPGYYEGKWLMADYSRGWIMSVTIDENGNYQSMEEFAPGYHPVQPLDTKFGPDGDFYVLEYGSNTVRSAAESRLVRIEYNAGNRKPVVRASASKKSGAVPFTTRLLTTGTVDYDQDSLRYSWKVDGVAPVESVGNEPLITLTKPGVYNATLTVTDSKGAASAVTLRLSAGNDPPVIDLKYSGNKTFFFPDQAISYEVNVRDKEDGKLNSGIASKEVAVTMDYVSEGFDFGPLGLGHAAADASMRHVVAQTIMQSSDCKTCHTINDKAVGPAFKQIAEKYAGKKGSPDTLAQSIIHGSARKWGSDNTMPAHPSFSINDARTIANYILSINDPAVHVLPMKGKFITHIPKDDNGRGTFIFRAAYRDRGAGSISPQTTDTVFALRSATLKPLRAEIIHGALRDMLDEYTFLTANPDSYIGFKQLDLTGVKQILFRANWHLYDIYAGGKIEIRIDKPDGQLIGETTFEPEQFNTRLRGLFDGIKNPSDDQIRRMKRYPPLEATKFFASGVDKSAFTIPSTASVQNASGIHDIYLVFIANSSRKGALFPLYEIVFMNTKSADHHVK